MCEICALGGKCMKILKMKALPKSMSTGLVLVALIFVCLVANQFGVAGSNFLFFLPQSGNQNTAKGAGVVSVSFNEINEMASEKLEGDYIYELSDSGAQVLGIKIPLTEKSALLQYHGEAKAGIKDAGKIQWTPNDKKKTITVSCPEVEILDCHTKIIKIWKTDGSIINHYKFDSMSEVIKETEKYFEKVLEKSDLLKRAKVSTRANLINMFHEQVSGDSKYSSYKVVVEWQTAKTKTEK